ncbi:unnamed protein product [Rotaria socialis]|uniref:catechol O-methyltransferase n=1 Tax=Rotaria socialis TaxID=392032 RepID=A0A820UI50_9BILA|nr:unnamed protein product [Rotaria socialis]CAF4482148.1 unnamed protein product [Rotaria socialis]
MSASSLRPEIDFFSLSDVDTGQEKMLAHVLKNSAKGNVDSVIKAIDDYCWTTSWMMNVGDRKGLILEEAIRKRQPKTVLELGTFCGYSSLRIVSQLPGDARFITIEMNPLSAAIAAQLHEHAGVTSRITCIVGSTDNVIPTLSEQFAIQSFDLIFIDHWKEVYLRDLQLLEQMKLIASGTVVVADNVITPGAPDYLAYIRNNPNYESIFHEAMLEYTDTHKDGVEISIRK